MSTGEPASPPKRGPTPRRRRDPVHFPSDPSDEDLAREWTLSEVDKALVLQARGNDNRSRFALMLAALRNYGRFLNAFDEVPVRIIGHVVQQLGQPPVLFLGPFERDATETEYEQRIRNHLGYQTFDGSIQSRLDTWLAAQVSRGLLPKELLRRTEDVLRSWKVVLPAPSTLERIVGSICTRSRQDAVEAIAGRLPPDMRVAIDALLEVSAGGSRSALSYLKEYPRDPNPADILTYVDRYRSIKTTGVVHVDLSGVSQEQVRQLADLARRHDAKELKRFTPSKRHAMVACFLAEAQKTVLDHLVLMHDKYITGVCRRSRRAFQATYQETRQSSARGLETLLAAAEILIDAQEAPHSSLAEIDVRIDRHALREAVSSCREFQRLEQRGYVDALRARYTHLRRYLPAFLGLPFQCEHGSQPIVDAIELVRKLDTGEIKELPATAPVEFVPSGWRSLIERESGALDRSLWEIALGLAVRDALRSGNLYLPESRRHVSFFNLLHGDAQWAEEREHAYRELDLAGDADEALARLEHRFCEVAAAANRGLPTNSFATIQDGRLKLSRRDALEVPDSVGELRSVIETYLPRVRIEHLLIEVDSWSGFLKELRPLGAYQPRGVNLSATLLAALVAHGTNLGIAAMGQSAEGISVDQLQHVSQWFLREETLKAANTTLIDFHHRLDLSAVWGEGMVSSSDGQRFGIQQSSLLGSFYPRYFGHYERAVSVLTHTSDQYSVFGTRVISCSAREAQYVLDGLLENDSILTPREHCTDTHGYTEHLFGMCYLLGYSFMPRLRDLADQQLYKVNGTAAYERLDDLFRGTVDRGLILEQWDQLVRVAASLAHRTAPPHVVLQRLSGGSRTDRLTRALTALGRVLKTMHILRYIQDGEMRGWIQRQLNRGESRHALARWIFFANQGAFRTGDYEEIMNKASCLSLLCNAVLVWNTVQIGRIVERLRTSGQTVSDDDLARTSPLLHGHVIPSGTYNFDRAIPGSNFAPNTLE